MMSANNRHGLCYNFWGEKNYANVSRVKSGKPTDFQPHFHLSESNRCIRKSSRRMRMHSFDERIIAGIVFVTSIQ